MRVPTFQSLGKAPCSGLLGAGAVELWQAYRLSVSLYAVCGELRSTQVYTVCAAMPQVAGFSRTYATRLCYAIAELVTMAQSSMVNMFCERLAARHVPCVVRCRSWACSLALMWRCNVIASIPVAALGFEF